MSSLLDLQQRAYRALLHDDPAVLVQTVAGSPAMACAGVGVYQNNARETYRRALAATYPVVEQLVGESCFATLARSYRTSFPSRCGDLAGYGASFPVLLEIYYGTTTFDYLAHVARLEWACAEAERARDAEPLDVRALQRVPAGRYPMLRLELHPATRLLSSPYPIVAIWEAHQNGEPSELDLRAPADHVLVTRRRNHVRVYRLDAGTFCFTASLAAGEPLLDAQEAAMSTARDFDSTGAMRLLFGLGLFVGFEDPSSTAT